MESYQPDSHCDEGLSGVSGSPRVIQVGLCWVSLQPELCLLLTEDGLLALASLSKNIRVSLMTQKKACVLGSLPGTAVFFFPPPPSWRMTGNFDLDQSAKIA